jgi:hypothetical protein
MLWGRGGKTVELRSTDSRGRLSPHDHLPIFTRDHLSVAVRARSRIWFK